MIASLYWGFNDRQYVLTLLHTAPNLSLGLPSSSSSLGHALLVLWGGSAWGIRLGDPRGIPQGTPPKESLGEIPLGNPPAGTHGPCSGRSRKNRKNNRL